MNIEQKIASMRRQKTLGILNCTIIIPFFTLGILPFVCAILMLVNNGGTGRHEGLKIAGGILYLLWFTFLIGAICQIIWASIEINDLNNQINN